MNNVQWQDLLDIIHGEKRTSQCGFIIDSPWLPKWAGISIMDYFTDNSKWFDVNRKAVEEFKDVIFLPGFWAEFGMCTEPSAFGAKCIWFEDQFPSAEKIIHAPEDIDKLTKPNPKTDGLGPFVIKRLLGSQKDITAMGHNIRFAVSRGPLNIASFLMGATEFLMLLKTDPSRAQKLIEIVTEYIVDWLKLQCTTFPSIDGIFVLDDIVGFIGDEDFRQFALDAFKKIFHSFDVSVKFFHNDADGLICAKYLEEMSVNLFNFSHNHPISQIRSIAGQSVALLGGIAPRDALAAGTDEQVKAETEKLIEETKNLDRVIYSCGGGMPPSVTSDRVRYFTEMIKTLS